MEEGGNVKKKIAIYVNFSWCLLWPPTTSCLSLAMAIASSGYVLAMAMAISMSASAASKVFVHSLGSSRALQFVYFTLSDPSLYIHPLHPPPLSVQVQHMVSPAEAATYAD